MDKFLAVLNNLQDVFTTAGLSSTHSEIDLPQIVVVGSQSTGKSSVLENIAKQNFLPRGMGIVTRRPLVLQMTHVTSAKDINGKEYDTWAQFLHMGDQIYTNMTEIQNEIVRDTDKVCGTNKGISDSAIHLKLYSTEIPDLTLVDLPGLTKIAVGDQPRDIDQKIERLVRSYIVKENSIILAVSAGNVDIANSDSLKLAREVDPSGSRTIAVITKCDLMETNEESVSLLDGTSVNVQLGIVGVINRSNKMLAEKTPIAKVLSKEENFFLDHFPTLSDKMGTPYLSSQLCDILTTHLKQCLPMLYEKISLQQERHRQILKDMGESTTDPHHSMIVLLSSFTDNISSSITGKYMYEKKVEKSKNSQQAGGKPVNEKSVTTSAGAELLNVFQSECTGKLSAIPADKNLSNLKDMIKGATGVQPALLVPEAVFNTLILKQLNLFDIPSSNAVEKSHQCIAGAIDNIAAKTLARYPRLEREVVIISKAYLAEQLHYAHEFIEVYLEVEKSYINTNHPEFVERYQLAAALFGDAKEENPKSQQPPGTSHYSYHNPTTLSALDKLMTKYKHGEDASSEERANKEAELMEKLLIQYFCIVRAHLVDMIPKTVMRFLVKKLSANLNGILIKELYREEKIGTLVQESDAISKKRNASSKMMGVLLKAEKLLADIAVGRTYEYEYE